MAINYLLNEHEESQVLITEDIYSKPTIDIKEHLKETDKL